MKDASGVDMSNLAAKRNLVALEANVDKLDINKLNNDLSGLNNWKIKGMMSQFLTSRELFLYIQTKKGSNK